MVALYILGLLPELIDLLEQVKFTHGKEKLNLWLILQGIGAVLVTMLVALWLGAAVEARLMSAQGLDANLRLVLSRLARALLILLAVLIGLPLVGIDLTTLSVFGGALGVGLGFGLQKIAANYVSGFIILLDRSIRIGNLIEVQAQRGVVTRITTRYTLLREQTGIEVIVPNEMLVGSVITNETLTDPRVRLAMQVQVAYGTDLERAMAILVAAARAPAARAGRSAAQEFRDRICRFRHQPGSRFLDRRSRGRFDADQVGHPPGDLASLQGGRHRDSLPATRSASVEQLKKSAGVERLQKSALAGRRPEVIPAHRFRRVRLLARCARSAASARRSKPSSTAMPGVRRSAAAFFGHDECGDGHGGERK